MFKRQYPKHGRGHNIRFEDLPGTAHGVLIIDNKIPTFELLCFSLIVLAGIQSSPISITITVKIRPAEIVPLAPLENE